MVGGTVVVVGGTVVVSGTVVVVSGTVVVGTVASGIVVVVVSGTVVSVGRHGGRGNRRDSCGRRAEGRGRVPRQGGGSGLRPGAPRRGL